MSKYVDAESLLRKLENKYKVKDSRWSEGFNEALSRIIATIKWEKEKKDVQEVIHAKWEKYGRYCLKFRFRCQHCGRFQDKAFTFCPNCGAKMDKLTSFKED